MIYFTKERLWEAQFSSAPLFIKHNERNIMLLFKKKKPFNKSNKMMPSRLNWLVNKTTDIRRGAHSNLICEEQEKVMTMDTNYMLKHGNFNKYSTLRSVREEILESENVSAGYLLVYCKNPQRLSPRWASTDDLFSLLLWWLPLNWLYVHLKGLH